MPFPVDSPRDPSRRRITEQIWRDLVNAFRATTDVNIVASRVGIDVRTAKKAWTVGLPYPFAQRPIRVLLLDEIHGRRAKEQTATSEEARTAREQHGAMIRKARENCKRMLEITGDMTEGAAELAAEVKSMLVGYAASDPAKVTRLLGSLAIMARATVEATEAAIKMERVFLGDAEKQDAAQMTREEAVRELEEGQKALDRAKVRWGDAAVGVESEDPEPDAGPESEPDPGVDAASD